MEMYGYIPWPRRIKVKALCTSTSLFHRVCIYCGISIPTRSHSDNLIPIILRTEYGLTDEVFQSVQDISSERKQLPDEEQTMEIADR